MINQLMKRKRIWGIFLSVFFVACFVSVNLAWAQTEEYPNKPIKIVVTYGPGGVTDICTRIIASKLLQELKVPIVIRNIAGASGMVGGAEVLKLKPDGYTLLSGSAGGMVVGPISSANPPYDPFKDFLTVCGYGFPPMVFGVHNSSPFKTLEEVIDSAKKNPGKVTCGVTNIGGCNHLNFELFRKAARVNIKIVPYKGTGQVMAALLGKHIDMMVLSYVGFRPYVKSGQARILALTAKFPGSPIPTISDMGYPQVRIHILNGFWVSSQTPKTRYQKLVSTFERVLKDPDVRKKIEEAGFLFEYKNPRKFDNELKEMWDSSSRLVEELGLKKK